MYRPTLILAPIYESLLKFLRYVYLHILEVCDFCLSSYNYMSTVRPNREPSLFWHCMYVYEKYDVNTPSFMSSRPPISLLNGAEDGYVNIRKRIRRAMNCLWQRNLSPVAETRASSLSWKITPYFAWRPQNSGHFLFYPQHILQGIYFNSNFGLN